MKAKTIILTLIILGALVAAAWLFLRSQEDVADDYAPLAPEEKEAMLRSLTPASDASLLKPKESEAALHSLSASSSESLLEPDERSKMLESLQAN